MHAAEHHSICWLNACESVCALTSIWAMYAGTLAYIGLSQTDGLTIAQPDALMPRDQGDKAGNTASLHFCDRPCFATI
jgi:hypothetical protein